MGNGNSIGNTFDLAFTRGGGATKSKPQSSRSDTTSTQAFATKTAGIDASILEAAAEVCRSGRIEYRIQK